MYEEIVKIEVRDLKNDLKKGDEIITEISPSGKTLRYSKKVGDARMAFIRLIQGLLSSKSISIEEATKATNLFGKKTSDLYWIKDTD